MHALCVYQYTDMSICLPVCLFVCLFVCCLFACLFEVVLSVQDLMDAKAGHNYNGLAFHAHISTNVTTFYTTVRPNKKETRFISEISSLPRKI